MAIFESVIFQRMRKSVGNITTYEAGGKQVLRQNPLQRKDKKSEPQLKHRDRMRTLKKICGYAIALSTVGFCTTSRKTAWNRFVQANLMREGVVTPVQWARTVAVRAGYRLVPSGLRRVLYRADKASRTCFACPAEKACDWSAEKKNMELKI